MGTTYDEMPYSTFALRSGHPNRIAALARLYGVDVAAPERASILELGCGSGGNLVHLAEEYPESDFMGIDISERHIAAAREFAAACGVSNVSFECVDVGEYRPGEGLFDYVICHGLFSWVPQDTQRRLLQCISSVLRPEGIGFVSYNVLPGWRQRGIIRDIMRSGAARAEGGRVPAQPADQLEAGRDLLEIVAKVRLRDDDMLGRYVREAIARFQDSDPAYLFHEYLEECNDPLLFGEFMKEACARGLQFLSEAKPALMSSDDLGEDVSRYLERFSADIIEQEQCIDVIRNRAFRETLLCRDGISLRRDLKASVFKNLTLFTDYRFVAEESNGRARYREVSTAREVVTPYDEHARILSIVGESQCRGVSFEEIKISTESLFPHERDLMHGVVRLWRSGFIDFGLATRSLRVDMDGRAVISRVARRQLERGDEVVTSGQHRSFTLSVEERDVLRLANGERSFEQLIDNVTGRPRTEVVKTLSRLLELGFFLDGND